MALAELELPTDKVSSVPDPRYYEPEQVFHLRPRFRLHANQSLGEQGAQAFSVPDPRTVSLPGPIQPYQLAVSGEEPISIDVSLQVVHLETTSPRHFVLRTPEGARPVKIEMRVNLDTLRLNLHYSIDLPGHPINEALHYTRFLKALYSEGTLSIVLLQPESVTIADVPLPIPLEEAQKQDLEWNLQLFENLSAIGEATGVEMTAPAEIGDKDLANLERVNVVLQTGWVRDHVSEFTLPLGPEAAMNLLEYGDNVIEGLAIASSQEQISLSGNEVDLGPNIRWISKARLETPLPNIQEWLASNPGPEDGFETRWTPIDEAPLHVVFHNWPRPSLERIQEDIKALEHEYGMSWRTFSRLWKQGKPKARRIADGHMWMSLIEARDALKQES